MSNSSRTDATRIVIALGPWSSGSTAIAGYLGRLGAWTCPPHQMTNDPLTPDSHEPKAFRDALCSVFNEMTLNPIRPVEEFTRFFGPWLDMEKRRAHSLGRPAILLKHPIAAFAIPQILQVCDPEFLVITRPMRQIEKSRLRRGWHPIYGVEGAQRIYSAIFSTLIARGRSFTAVSYPDFLRNPTVRVRLAQIANLTPTTEMLTAAECWLRIPAPAAPTLVQREIA